MLNIDRAILYLDSNLECRIRDCDDCKYIYDVVDCPSVEFEYDAQELLRILQLAKTVNNDKVEISEDEIIALLE